MKTRLSVMGCLAAGLAVIVGLGGCATGPTYKATATSLAEGAYIVGAFKRSGPLAGCRVTVEQVDGRQVKPGLFRDTSTRPALIDAGERSLFVVCEYRDGFNLEEIWSASATLSVVLQAGHSYQLQFDRQKRLVTFWVEDSATRLPVSNRQTTVATIQSDSIYGWSFDIGTGIWAR